MTIRDLTVGEIYTHFKYKTDYVIVGFSKSTNEDCTIGVLYVELSNYELYKNGEIIPWSRDITEFNEQKEVEGKLVKRFVKNGSIQ